MAKLPLDELGVDDGDERALLLADGQVDDDDPERHADLGSGEADPGGGVHGLHHVADQRGDGAVDLLHRRGRSVEDGVAPLHYLAQRHGLHGIRCANIRSSPARDLEKGNGEPMSPHHRILVLALVAGAVSAAPALAQTTNSPHNPTWWDKFQHLVQDGPDAAAGATSSVSVGNNVDVSNECGPQSETYITINPSRPNALAAGSNEI